MTLRFSGCLCLVFFAAMGSFLSSAAAASCFSRSATPFSAAWSAFCASAVCRAAPPVSLSFSASIADFCRAYSASSSRRVGAFGLWPTCGVSNHAAAPALPAQSLTKRLDAAEVVDPATRPPTDQIFFGATVRYLDGAGREQEITIVGIDEVDPPRRRVSWISPIARALMKAREGDVVALRTPAGVDELEVLTIRYAPID